LLLASLATHVMIVIARRRNLLVSGEHARVSRIRAAVVPGVMVLSIGLSWWSTTVAVYSWILLAVAPAFFIRWSARGARG
jgi:hypothetical protein